ncbi:MAG: TIGR01777 family oxidoreductase, partial [Chthoniobacterales bacterium]|nr:TIGR01777 family oxidoreductase [Chthoniobacterales bacterium]
MKIERGEVVEWVQPLQGKVVGVTGASGFLGRSVRKAFLAVGAKVLPFSRRPARLECFAGEETAREFRTDGKLDFSECQIVLHLAGENVFGVWTQKKRQRILESRIEGTRAVVRAIQRSAQPVTLICASATGFFGDRGEEELTEDSPRGNGFLAEVCQRWEAEARKAEENGARVCIVRLGMVLGKTGGAFPILRSLFWFGLGGMVGSGKQWMPAVHILDAVRIFLALAADLRLCGVFNASVPSPFRSEEFVWELARLLRRPAIFHLPSFFVRMVLGELSELILASQRVFPKRLLGIPFGFVAPN